MGRINRYIMECKSLWTNPDIADDLELIDTLWNVNLLPSLVNNLSSGINRYIMECK